MARALTYGEEQLYLRLVDAAGSHVRGVLGVVGAGPDAADVRAALATDQYQALGRLVRGARTDEFGGVRFRRGPGPIRPSRTRALKTGLQAVMAAHVADAAPPAQGQMSEADYYLDRGLRTAFAEQELGSFMERNGVRRPLTFGAVRDRGADTHVYGVAANALVGDIAKRTNMSKRDVMQQLLTTPPDKRIDLAAGMLSGRAGGMPAQQRDYARNAMANTMRGQFGRLGRTATSFDQIGQRWKRLPRWMKILVGVVVVTNPSCIPLLLAARATRAIQRSQRFGHRRMAAYQAHAAVRTAERTLARELQSVGADGRPVVGRHAPTPGRQTPQSPQPWQQFPGRTEQLDWASQQAWARQHPNQGLNGPGQVQPPWPPGYDAPIPVAASHQQPGLDTPTQPIQTPATAANQSPQHTRVTADPQQTPLATGPATQPVPSGLDAPTQRITPGANGPQQTPGAGGPQQAGWPPGFDPSTPAAPPTQEAGGHEPRPTAPEEPGTQFQWPAELAWPGDGVKASASSDPASRELPAGWNAATTGIARPQPGAANAAESESARPTSTTRGRTTGPNHTRRGE
jgi:hypothetical protein